MKEAEKMTDEQLWELCSEEEKKKEIILESYRDKDKGVDWDYERFIWEIWNPREWK